MSDLPGSFRAFVAERDGDQVIRELRELGADDLPDGEVTIEVAYSSVNYKDALATIPKGQVARISPLVPGIDLAGRVVSAEGGDVSTGDEVLVHGYALGVSHHGGYSRYARVPAGWVVPLPAELTARQAMAIGTAGFTAGLSVQLLEERGLAPERGQVLVTGATGGVGSTAVSMLAGLGYEVVASTGKEDQHDWLRELGAAEVIGRDETSADSERPLESQRWAGAVDAVGGSTLAYILRTLRTDGAVAACGNTAGPKLATTVLPFILRGVALLGADSVNQPLDRRRRLWKRLATDLRPRDLDGSITSEVDLDGLEAVLDEILAGRNRGRTVVRLTD